MQHLKGNRSHRRENARAAFTPRRGLPGDALEANLRVHRRVPPSSWVRRAGRHHERRSGRLTVAALARDLRCGLRGRVGVALRAATWRVLRFNRIVGCVARAANAGAGGATRVARASGAYALRKHQCDDGERRNRNSCAPSVHLHLVDSTVTWRCRSADNHRNYRSPVL